MGPVLESRKISHYRYEKIHSGNTMEWKLVRLTRQGKAEVTDQEGPPLVHSHVLDLLKRQVNLARLDLKYGARSSSSTERLSGVGQRTGKSRDPIMIGSVWISPFKTLQMFARHLQRCSSFTSVPVMT